MKKDYYIFGLIGVGAAIVLYWLWYESQSAAAAPSTATGDVIPVSGAQPSYPNVQPIQLGNVTINDGTAPPTQFASATETVPRVNFGTPHSDCGCMDDDCEQAGVPVTSQTITPAVLKSGADNLAGFMAKTSAPTSGVEAARLSLSTNTTAPPGGGSFSAA